jgi:hypothetical protein
VPGESAIVVIIVGVTNETDALRRDVRLLGDTLGLVIVEQEGEEILELEERVRRLSLAGRRGSAEAMEQLVEFVGSLDLEQQALVLRAFAVYFHLVNIAEQHHRIRRRRAYENEGRTPPESLADAEQRLGTLEDAARDASVELVLTSHPTEATRRTILRAHRRIAELLRELDTPELPPSALERIRRRLAEEVRILWQTSARAARTSSTRSGTGSGSSSRASGRPHPICLASCAGVHRSRRSCRGSAPGSEVTSTATRTPAPRRSRPRSSGPAISRCGFCATTSWNWRAPGACRPRSSTRHPGSATWTTSRRPRTTTSPTGGG